MHHTMADGSYDRFLDAYAHVTAAHARLTPRNAAAEIDRLVLTAWREKLPVYMELPSDIAYLDIEIPAGPLALGDPPSDPERLRSCIAAIAGRMSAATSPAILVDADADRFGVASELMELAEKMQAPIAVINTAKGVIDETFLHYLGIYMGKASEPHVREAIETSDCLLAIGYRPIEVTTGDFTASLPAHTIHARGHSVDVGDDNYQAVTLKEVLRGVIDAVPQVRNRAPRHVATSMTGMHADASAKLTQAAYWRAIQGYLREGDVLFVDNGTSYALFGLKFPPKCAFVGSVNWGSIGYSVGALLGTLTAAPERRHLLFVGDGSFQVTALGAIDHSATRPQAGDLPDQQWRIHHRTRLPRQG
jgi:indolepyruvate decarboxylase